MTQQFPPAQPPGPDQPWQSGATRQPQPQQPWQQQSQQWQPQQQQPWQQKPQQQQPEAGQPKRRKVLLLGAAAAIVALGVALTLILSLTGGPDLSSPQAAAQSWADAVNDKDAGAVIDTVCPEQVVTTSSAAVDALQESIDAAPGGRYGAEGRND